MKKRIILVALIIIVTVTISVWTINNFQKSPQNTSNARLNNAGYLGESKLFLVSANASYGVYSVETWKGGVFYDQDCFVITATIRNDYNLEELQMLADDPYYALPPGRVFFVVHATLYDDTSQVLAKDVTRNIAGSMSSPVRGPQWTLYCGETDTVEIYMATNNRNIGSYTVNLDIIELSGRPIP
jgi:hypothetical protein